MERRFLQPVAEDHLAFVGAPRIVIQIIGIGSHAVEQLITELVPQLLQDGAFDGVFGDEVGHGW